METLSKQRDSTSRHKRPRPSLGIPLRFASFTPLHTFGIAAMKHQERRIPREGKIHFPHNADYFQEREQSTKLTPKVSETFRNIIGHQVRELRLLKGWTHATLAAELKDAGREISRSDVAKIESRIKFVKDFEFRYLVEVLEIQLEALFPQQLKRESADHYLTFR